MAKGKMTSSKTGGVAALAVKTLFFMALWAALASAATTSATNEGCSIDECVEDEDCLACVSLDSDFTEEDVQACSADYVDDDSSQCGFLGAAWCCQSDSSGTPTCTNNEVALEYWTCVLEAEGCSITDMPCIGAETPAPVTTMSPTNAEAAEDNSDDANGAMAVARPLSRLVCAGTVGIVAVVGMLI